MAQQLLSILNRVKGAAGGAVYSTHETLNVIRPIIPRSDPATPAQLLCRQYYTAMIHMFYALESYGITQLVYPFKYVTRRWAKFSSRNLKILNRTDDYSLLQPTTGVIAPPAMQLLRYFPDQDLLLVAKSSNLLGYGSPDDLLFIFRFNSVSYFANLYNAGKRSQQLSAVSTSDPAPGLNTYHYCFFIGAGKYDNLVSNSSFKISEVFP